MATAELPRRRAWPALGELPRGRAWAALAVVLAVALGLRLWGIRQGLPWAYNSDEGDHFVPRAVAMFSGDLNPHYFANPPAFTYLLHLLFAIAYGGAAGVHRAYALHPTGLYTLARAAAAVLGTAAVWLLYATGARLFGRAVGLLAAAIEAVAFLPVFYAHLALNDAPTLAPATLSLLGTAGVLRKGRARDYALAGLGLGLACATKYTAGIVVLPFGAAVAARVLVRRAPPARCLALAALAAVVAVAAFWIANPYSLLDYSRFHSELVRQSSLSVAAQGKLGAPREAGIFYYLWSLTWGLGWVPAIAAFGGALTVWRYAGRAPSDGVVLGFVLVPAVVAFLAFMGIQGRYFGRWLMPIIPVLCLLGAFFAVALIGLARSRWPHRRRLHAALTVAIVALLVAQGLIYSVHSGLVLSRADTRSETREWMVAHIPPGSRIVVEPVAPDAWAAGRWRKYPSLKDRLGPGGEARATPIGEVGLEDFERTLAPSLVGYYTAHGYCWVITGSTQSGRAFADPGSVPGAIAYYRALSRAGEVAFRASPYARGRGPVAFGFDWSFDYYPLAYERPGPLMTVYRLHGGRCAR